MKFLTDRLTFSKVHLRFPVGQIDLSEVKNAYAFVTFTILVFSPVLIV